MRKLSKARHYVARRNQLLTGMVQKHQNLGIGYDLGPMPLGHGRLQVQLRAADRTSDPDAWETVVDDDNLVVLQAETIMAQMAIQAPNSGLSYIELGDPVAPATPPQLSDITLQQTTGQRKAGTVTAAGSVVTVEVIFDTTEANGFTYTEAGLFNGLLGAGSMFARKTFAGIAKSAGFQMRFLWNITFLVQTQGGDCAGVSLIGPSSITALTVAPPAAGGEASIAATFDFQVGANNVDVFLDRQRLYPGVHYLEVGSGGLAAPVLGPVGNKGVNLIGFTLNPANEVLLIQRTLN